MTSYEYKERNVEFSDLRSLYLTTAVNFQSDKDMVTKNCRSLTECFSIFMKFQVILVGISLTIQIGMRMSTLVFFTTNSKRLLKHHFILNR